jgi:hypothetical protein
MARGPRSTQRDSHGLIRDVGAEPSPGFITAGNNFVVSEPQAQALVSPITKESAAEAAAPQLDANIQIVYGDTAARLGVDSRKRVQGTCPSNPQ